MGLEVFLGLILLVLSFLLVTAFFGFIALITENWLLIITVVITYLLLRKHLNKFHNEFRKKPIYQIIYIMGSILGVVILFLLSIHAMVTRYSDKLYSPDRKYYVQIEEVNGGATTAYQTGVAISDATFIFNSLPIVSFRTGNAETVLFFSGSVESAKPTWIDNRTLKIRYECARLYDEPVKKWRDIKIIYEKECE